MRIAVMAAGAVGGYFGARLAAAGHEVHFIARGAHADALRRDGLILHSTLGDLHLKQVNVTDDPRTVGPVDVVLFAVKLWDTDTAAQQALPLLGPSSRLITLQNGIDSYERVAPIAGAERTVAGVTYVVSVIDRPGVIKQTSAVASIVCGTIDKRPDAKLNEFAGAAKAAGIDITVSDDIERDRWHKFILLSATSGATAVTRVSMGPILADPDMRAMFRNLMSETLAVGKAKGVALDEAYIDERMKFIAANFPPGMKASLANDLDRGNRLELDWLAGRVAQLGQELNVPVPVNATVYAALKPHRMGKR